MRQTAKRRAKFSRLPPAKNGKFQSGLPSAKLLHSADKPAEAEFSAFALKIEPFPSVRRAAKCLLSPRRTPQRQTGFSQNRMPAHETFPRRTQNSRRTAGQRAFPTECAHAKFHSKKRANNAQERRRGGVYCRISQTPCPAPPECPKKNARFRGFRKRGADGRESGLCAPAKSLNTSICTR